LIHSTLDSSTASICTMQFEVHQHDDH
jgi:hypothetical protein